MRDASAPSEPLVSLALDTRKELNIALRKMRPPALVDDSHIQIQILGTLRGLELDKDWLEVATVEAPPGVPSRVHIEEISEVLDDVVGPMVNKPVVVTVVRRGSKFIYTDIELQE